MFLLRMLPLLWQYFNNYSFFDKNLFQNFEIMSNIKSENILLFLEIPKVHLKEEVYSFDSSFNDVDLHVQILEDSKVENYFFILAGHSGSGKASYFNKLKYVEEGDLILVTLKDKVLYYLVIDTYYIYKSGSFSISTEDMNCTLYLITCSLDYPSKQFVVKAKLEVLNSG